MGLSSCALSSTARLLSGDGARVPGVQEKRPRCRAVRAAPGDPTVHGDLDSSDDAAARIGRRARDRDGRPRGTLAPDDGDGDGRRRRGRVGRRAWPRRARPAGVPGCTPMSASRLTVACCMRTSAAALPRSWLAVEAPRPLDRAGAEHQRPAGMPVQRQAVRGGPRPVGRAVVLKHASAPRRWSSTDSWNRPGGRTPLSTSSSHS